MDYKRCKQKWGLLIALFFASFSVFSQATKAKQILNDFYNHPEYVLVAAHRGAHQEYAENSISAIKEAIRLGVDIIELDVRETKDHQLVLMHDATIDRTTTGKGRLKDFTLEELQKERLLHNGVATDLRIPTFKEVLKEIKDEIIMDVDFKIDSKQALKQAYQMIQSQKIQSQILFFISNPKRIKTALELDSTIAILPRAYSYSQVKKIINNKKLKAVHIDFSFYQKAWVKEISQQGYRVWANALGTYDQLQRKDQTGFQKIVDKHINIIQTDYPKELIVFLRKKHLHR